MSSDVDAVIAALRTILEEAEARHAEFWWKTHIVNRWIDQLPGAWWGRWRSLRLRPDSGNLAQRPNLLTHVRATLAYLETNRDAIAAQSSWWPFSKALPKAVPSTTEAVRKEVPSLPQHPRDGEGTTRKPKWLN